MMYSFRVLFALGCLLAAGGLRAQSTAATVPVTTQAISAQYLVAGGEALAFNFSGFFKIANLTGTALAQFDTTKGKFNVQLLGNDAPKTVANFQAYVNAGSYTNSLIHRSQPNLAPNVIQGGGYYLNGSTITPVSTQAAVQNEYKLSNIRGTLAMAKTSAGPDTATSQWFVNLAENTTTLGTSNNGGYTVFGQVLGTGMTVVDALAAVPSYDKSTQLGAAFGQLPLLADALTTGNLVLVKSINPIAVYPDVAGTLAILNYGKSSNSNSSVVKATINGSVLILTPLAEGSATITLRATDTNGNTSDDLTFGVIVSAAPAFTTQPQSQGVAPGGTLSLTSQATGSPSYKWQLNGDPITGGTAAGINITNFQVTYPGLFTSVATAGNTVATSQPAIIGMSTTSKVVGPGEEVGKDIYVAANGKTYDQVLLGGAAAAVTADFSADDAKNQITRISYVDLQDDIVQVEYSGPGTLSLVLESSSGPAQPVKYNQNVSYMRGHASIIITGANEYSNVSVFSVGRITAVNQALFKSDVTYDGTADIGLIAISSTNGKFGGIRTANASYYNVKGYTGIYAPGVAFQGPVFVNTIEAFSAAKPVLMLGSASDVRVTGGNLYQDNGQPVRVSGITQLKFTAGVDSHGNGLAAQINKAVLVQDGNDVTTQIVVNPVQ